MVLTLAEKVTYRMRQIGVLGRTATLSIRNNDLTHSSHSITTQTAIDNAEDFAKMCMQIFDKHWKANTPYAIRAVRVSLSNLERADTARQINLFDYNKNEKLKKLNESLDKIRDKYGYYAVRRAKTIERDFINYYEADEEEAEAD